MSTATAGENQSISCAISDSFAAWISQINGSLLVTTYQAGKVALIGWDGHQVTLLLRHFDKPMGLAVRGRQLALATRHEVLLLADAPLLAHEYLESQPGRYDSLFVPRAAYFTGDINAHDLAFGDDGLWVVNTRFCCLSAVSEQFSFIPRWQPPFISELAPEDRCHLNGLALVDGRPRYVTALGETDTVGGWRANKAAGGVLLEVPSGEVVRRGLSMPHSPRWYDNRLWLLNSGAGELWQIDPRSGDAQTVCVLPGYLRGLSFVGPYAVVGMSQIREKHIFGGLPIEQRFARLVCGVAIVDLRTGREVALFEFTAGCQELFEAQFLPGTGRPMILNRDKEASRQAFTAPEFSYWLRPSNEVTDEAAAGSTPARTAP